MADNRPVYYAYRNMTVDDLKSIIDVLRGWLRELDTTQKYAHPNGHVWNAVDIALAKKHD